MSNPAAAQLLAWYARARRDLPWRARPGRRADPYRVWLSEIMLQQTTVAAAQPYFLRFIQRWPDIAALAAAPLDEVLKDWAGLGYYARARNLHACARAVAARHGGHLPDTEAALRELPGIGPYTAAAIAAIAFGRKATPVDGNIERVVVRLFAIETPLPGAKAEIRRRAEAITPEMEAGDFAQAMMDLGATVCLPRAPLCERCPLAGGCAGRAAGIAPSLPRKAARKERPRRHGVAFVLRRADGAILLRRRAPQGLLGGMTEVPSTDWRAEPWTMEDALREAPAPAEWRVLPEPVEHTFTHFHLSLTVLRADGETARDGIFWRRPEELADEALPSVMRKVCRRALG
ncbi:MAG: A/G-specific adenine glycosylase [Alphaproteobacteria bacterium]|nr:A/G-specific adenine glycosylase [Alphaproteobacteria bacterium]